MVDGAFGVVCIPPVFLIDTNGSSIYLAWAQQNLEGASGWDR